MNFAKVAILAAFAIVLSAPFVARLVVSRSDGSQTETAAADRAAAAKNTLIIVTPHIEQIREEFAFAFSRWHKRTYGQPAKIDWRAPGGTTEILKLLDAQFTERVKSGLIKPDGSCVPGTIDFDVAFGGGSFDHNRIRNGIRVPAAGIRGLDLQTAPKTKDGKLEDIRVAMSVPPSPLLTVGELNAVYGENVVGAGQLYHFNPKDPADQQYWFGSALSGFGIVFNRDYLRRLGIAGDPTSFQDLRAPALMGALALADPRQSGSVATAYDSILNEAARASLAAGKAEGASEAQALALGWSKGWDTLREICANARYFAAASTMPPQDVSQGEAAAGLAIDFYGRGQAQAILRAGQDPATGRVGYVDPQGATYIDADPVSIIRGGPRPDLARRFVEFCLTVEAQALWQFAPVGRGHRIPPGTPALADGTPMGPQQHRLRRMPVRRAMYNPADLVFFADKTDPFAAASSAKVQGWRDGMIIMMGCFGVDAGDELRAARRVIERAKASPTFNPDTLAEMQRLFYSFPPHAMADGRILEFTSQTYKAISDDVKRWRDPARSPVARIGYTEYFRATFRKVVELGQSAS